MKFNSILKAVALPAIAAFLFVGCTGPAGPEGPAGANGVANISSLSYSVTSWAGGPNYFNSVSFPETDITNAPNDLVEVYWATNTAGVYIALPASNQVVTGDQISAYIGNDYIQFDYYDPSGSPSGTWNFVVVVVPPAIQKKHPNTNWKNYTEVKAIMDLQPAAISFKKN